MGSRARTIETAPTVSSSPRGERSSGDEPPPNIPGYEIEGELGRGGMGVVYRAVQSALQRRVALKMILAAADAEDRARFISEAEAVAKLQHPNIVQIYEVGESEGRPYFSLEFVEGGSLEDRFGGKPMAWRAATKLVAVLAHAVHAAHLHGIVHRDLKPANVLLGANDTPKLTDFGIAKRLGATKQTQTGKILGTPCYMSPEQALGKNDQVGPATDIYALGAMLYDALTGRPPFEADNTLDTIMQAVLREPVPPRELQPGVPRDLEVICLKCLEKKPEKRYATALELAEDLERLLKGEPIHARPAGKLERTGRWAKRNPAWASLAGVSVVAFFALLTIWAWFTRELHKELRATEVARREATQARNELRLRLVRSQAQAIDADLRQLAGVPRALASALTARSDWSDTQLRGILSSELAREPHIFGMAIAFEPHAFRADIEDFSLYIFRGKSGLESKQLLPPEYTPIYREWEWYRAAAPGGSWSEPYVDEGGGEIPMVTFSMPFARAGKLAGVVTADLSLDYFRSLDESIKGSGFGPGSYAFVTTGKGTLVSHPDPRFRFPAPGSKPPAPKDPGMVLLWARITKGEAGGARGADVMNGKLAEHLFAPVPSAGWSCVAVVPD